MQRAAHGSRDDVVVDSRRRFAAGQWFWRGHHRCLGKHSHRGCCLRYHGNQRKDDHNSTAMADFEIDVPDLTARSRDAIFENAVSMQIASFNLQNENPADRRILWPRYSEHHDP